MNQVNNEKERFSDIQSQIVIGVQPKLRLEVKEIQKLMKKYESRTLDEDIDEIIAMGGIEGIESRLKSNLVNGLNMNDNQDIQERIEKYDKNTKIVNDVPSCCAFAWDILGDTMLRILIVAAVVQICLGASPLSANPSKDWVEGFSLVIAVGLVTGVGSIVNYKKALQFKELNEKTNSMAMYTVKRNGEMTEIKDEDILVGDVLKLNYGNIIPADGIVISSNEMKVDESALTGESDNIEKERIEKCIDIREREKIKKEAQENRGDVEIVKDTKHLIPSPIVASGTMVKFGSGWILVLAVGPNSKKGMIQLQVIKEQESDDSKTPLEIRLDDIAELIGYFGMISALFTLIALAIRLGVTQATKDKDVASTSVGNGILNIILLCVAIVVVAIPEGMPLAVTLSLAFAVKKMMKEKNLVRKMHACETMGNATYICTDKTGTLTQNLMVLHLLYDGDKVIDLRDIASKKEGSVSAKDKIKNYSYYEELKLSIILNLEIEIDENGVLRNASNTDIPFVNLFKVFGEDVSDIRKRFYPNDGSQLRKFPFSSERKKMSIILHNDVFPKGYRIFLKGAAEVVLQNCKYILNSNSALIEELTQSKLTEIQRQIKTFGENALRCICICYKDIDEGDYNCWKNLDENGNNVIEQDEFVFLAVVGIKDTLREGVVLAVEQCFNAGIKIIMITGDNQDTAFAIAQECGIVNSSDDKNSCAILGEDFYKECEGIFCETCSKKVEECKCPITAAEAKTRKNKSKEGNVKEDDDKNANEDKELNEDEKEAEEEELSNEIRRERIGNMAKFTERVASLKVIARSRPDDKYALVLGLRKMDNVVAVTGDGTNDAKALAKSDVGFSMGIMGTDIAKDAADIIILDDNFASIVQAVKWGRNIYDNIRKFIVFQLTVNACSVVLVFVCACVGNETPITAIQMLWLNLIMDSLGSLTLATEPPNEKLLDRKPYPKSDPIINLIMWKHILFHATTLFLITFLIYLVGQHYFPESESYRIEQGNIIYICYGVYPGHSKIPTNPYLVMAGSGIYWSPSTKLLSSATAEICGGYMNQPNLQQALIYYQGEYGNSSHITIIFNIFVFYSLFNQINARVIDDKVNIFYQISKNYYFIVILSVECFLQVLLIEFGSSAFQVSFKGLDAAQWGLCIAWSLLTFPFAILFKYINADKFLLCTFAVAGFLIDLSICFKFACCRKKDNKVFDSQKENEKLNELKPIKSSSNSVDKKDEERDNSRGERVQRVGSRHSSSKIVKALRGVRLNGFRKESKKFEDLNF